MSLWLQCNECKSLRQPISQDVLAKGYGHVRFIDYLPYGVFAQRCKCGLCSVYEQNGAPAVYNQPGSPHRPFRIGTRKELTEDKSDSPAP